MAKKTRTELSTLAINTNLPDNTTELITPTTERAQLTDERESVVNYKDDLGGVPNAGKFLTVAVDGESLTMVDAPTGDVTGTGTQYQLAVWDGTSALTGYAALTYINSILQAPQLRADSANGTVTINATDASGGTAWLYFQNASVLKAEISYFIQDDFLTIRTYQKDIVFERSVNTPTLTIDGTTGDATFSSKVKVSDGGNATTPSFRMGVDTNGISTPFTNQLNFITNSLTRLTIESGGATIFGSTSSATSTGASIQHLSNGFLYVKGGSSGASFGDDSQGTRMVAFNDDYLRFDTGGSGEKMRITSGGVINSYYGIAFPNQSAGSGTVSSSTLDAYEEGTWTPQIFYQNSSDQANATNSTQTGIYTRIGNLVKVQFRLIWVQTNTPAVDNIGIKNIPFIGNASNVYSEVPCFLKNYTGGPSPRGNLTLSLPGFNSSHALFNDTNFIGNMGNAIGSGTKEIRFSFSYLTN